MLASGIMFLLMTFVLLGGVICSLTSVMIPIRPTPPARALPSGLWRSLVCTLPADSQGAQAEVYFLQSAYSPTRGALSRLLAGGGYRGAGKQVANCQRQSPEESTQVNSRVMSPCNTSSSSEFCVTRLKHKAPNSAAQSLRQLPCAL